MNTYQTFKKQVEGALQWVIFSDIYITLGAVSFACVNAKLLGLSLREMTYLFTLIGSSTMFIYQFSRWSFFRKTASSLSKDMLYFWMQKHNRYVLSSLVICFIMSFALIFKAQFQVILTLLILGAVSFTYNITLPIGKSRFTLRKIPFLKVFLIAWVWASMAVILPWLESGNSLVETKVWYLFALQFLFIFIITLPFDMNDIQADMEVGVKTLPIVLGVRKSKVLLAGLTIAYMLLFSFWLSENLLLGSIHKQILTLGIEVLLLTLLYKTIFKSEVAKKWQIMLWYDGSLILYWMIYWSSGHFAHLMA